MKHFMLRDVGNGVSVMFKFAFRNDCSGYEVENSLQGWQNRFGDMLCGNYSSKGEG